MVQEEYFVVERENNDHYPLFACDQAGYQYGLGTPIVVNEPLKFRLRDPISAKFEWVDFHAAPEPLLSLALADVLDRLNLYGVQIIPASVRNPKDASEKPHHYYFLHVWNRISCVDKANSIMDCDEVDGDIWGIDKLVLNEAVLNNIPLPQRLVFELAEKTSVLLVHLSVKTAIETINPKGIRFFPVSQWNSDSSFD